MIEMMGPSSTNPWGYLFLLLRRSYEKGPVARMMFVTVAPMARFDMGYTFGGEEFAGWSDNLSRRSSSS